MSVKNKTNKHYKRSQKGRSMVEMLGVLAIIGVLSVGGVYGYGVAMKKHKANEALHKASLMATTVSAYAMSNDGALPSTITDFTNSGYATSLSDNGTQFKLTVVGIGFDVCTQMKNVKGGMVRDVVCDETSGDATITYYKNLATNEAEGEKSPTGGTTEPTDPACEGVECPEGTTCGVAGNCIAEKTTDETCSKNSDCDKWCEDNGKGVACYCSINAESTDDDSACYNNFTGVCAVATPKSKGGYVANSDPVTWWSAVNFCKAHGKSLVSLADLGITDGYQDDAYCEGSECTGTFTWSDLKDKLGSDYYWVTDAVSCDCDFDTWECECTSGTNNNSCDAFRVSTYESSVCNGGRYGSGDYYALCVDK